MPSFQEINYFLRTNKNIERKLFFDAVKHLGRYFNLNNYHYLGFGSIWFVDFVIAHKKIGISNLCSIEGDKEGFLRADFNRPFNCISVEEGQSNLVLPELDIWESPIIAWLDYDKVLATSGVLIDIPVLCERAKSGSVILISVNGDSRQLNVRPNFERALDKIDDISKNEGYSENERLYMIQQFISKAREKRVDRMIKRLKEVAEDYIPAEHSEDNLKGYLKQDVSTGRDNFHELLAKIILNIFTNSMNMSGREEKFIPMFNFAYKDNALMVSVGGMIANKEDETRLEESGLLQNWFITGKEQLFIKAPPLTIREKLCMDQLLPKGELTVEELKRKYELTISEEQLKEYKKFYRHYPVYGELEI